MVIVAASAAIDMNTSHLRIKPPEVVGHRLAPNALELCFGRRITTGDDCGPARRIHQPPRTGAFTKIW
jgi:hypothetical protein